MTDTTSSTPRPLSRRKVIAGGAALAWSAPALTGASRAFGAEGSELDPETPPTEPVGTAAYSLKVWKIYDERYNRWYPGNPVIKVTNLSTGLDIVSWSLTIGDVGRDFDVTNEFPVDRAGDSNYTSPSVVETRTAPLSAPGDVLSYTFSAFPEGARHTVIVDIDEDGSRVGSDVDHNPAFYQTFFGNGAADNSVITVSFSDGVTPVRTLSQRLSLANTNGSHPYNYFHQQSE